MTAAVVAVKGAVADPAGTVTDAGTVTALLLLARDIAKPPLGAAAVRVTVQTSLAAPVSELLAQESALSAAGADVALRLIAKVRETPPALAVRVAV